MKLYAPGYYSKFKCTAEKCTHSCCVGWEIDVDSDTIEKYKALEDKKIADSIDILPTPHFRLAEDERCPHLDQKGLCNIISRYGEEYLCDICKEHPRFYNRTAIGVEVGLGMVCEEACRIILGSDDYDTLTQIGECEADPAPSFDIIPHRERIFDILKDIFLYYTYKIHKISAVYDVQLSTLDGGEWMNVLAELEYLIPSHKELFSHFRSDSAPSEDIVPMLERAFAYFVYRHVSSAEDEGELRARIGLCLFLERLLRSIVTSTDTDVYDAARIISEEIEYSEENTKKILDIFR